MAAGGDSRNQRRSDPLVPRNIPPFRWPSHLLQGLGMIPAPICVSYYMKTICCARGWRRRAAKLNPREVVKQLENLV